jgi:hypothetical protein
VGRVGRLAVRERAGKTQVSGILTWNPVYRLIRKSGPYPVEEAQELTQEFFAYLLGGRRRAARARKESFLKGILRAFLSKVRRRPGLGRKDGRLTLSLEGADPEIEVAVANLEHLSPDERLNRHWAEEILSQSA